jgi:predicted RNase H-like HicB family nuclease
MRFVVDVEREEDGRWIAELTAMQGVFAYGSSRRQAIARALALAIAVIADRLKHGEVLRTDR